jgi:hypothetical protein
MASVFPGIRVADTSNVVTYLKSDRARRLIVPIGKEPEKVMAIRSRLFEAIEESGLSILIFARDCASLPRCFEELVKIVGFVDEMRSDTVFPVSYDVEQSKIDDQKESYTIVFDKIGKISGKTRRRYKDGGIFSVKLRFHLDREGNNCFFFFVCVARLINHIDFQNLMLTNLFFLFRMGKTPCEVQYTMGLQVFF